MIVERGTSGGLDVWARIDRFLTERGLSPTETSILPLTGDASERRYFRVRPRQGASQVLAVYPGPIAFEALPFVNVARLLSAMPVPVPRVLSHSDALGIVAVQDLGDVTLQAHVGAASTAAYTALYRQAVTLIHTIQARGVELASPTYLPYGIAFDVEKLTWELQFFTTHFVKAYRGATLTVASLEALATEYALIVEELASEPRVLCHRDYHSRNLMLHEGSLYIIDFQDARMGPDTYDLVSLLRDSYVDVTERQVEELIAFFLTQRRDGAADAHEYRRRFDVMAVQRNLKALGTFGFHTTSRGSSVYIQYIPRTLNAVRANLTRHKRFGRLREILAEYLKELN